MDIIQIILLAVVFINYLNNNLTRIYYKSVI